MFFAVLESLQFIQVLCITAINFQRQSLIGLVELTLNPIKNNVRWVRLNCKQCKIYR